MSSSTPTAETIVPEALTLLELSKLLMVSERTAWQWARDGIAPEPLKIGKGTVRYSRAAYIEWIRSGCKPIRGGQNDGR